MPQTANTDKQGAPSLSQIDSPQQGREEAPHLVGRCLAIGFSGSAFPTEIQVLGSCSSFIQLLLQDLDTLRQAC